MPCQDLDLDIPPLLTASVLLAARQFALASGISWPGIADILAATGANPEEAHAMEDTLLDQLAALAVMVARQPPPPDVAGLAHGAQGPAVDLDVPPLVTIGVLLAARRFALASGISWPGLADIVAMAGGASPEEARVLEDALLEQLAALVVKSNHQTPPPDADGLDRSAELFELAVEMIRFIQQNPGCAQTRPDERYTDRFRRFTLELRRRYADVATTEFAVAVDLPLDTVEDWLRGGRRDVDMPVHATYPRAARGARARHA